MSTKSSELAEAIREVLISPNVCDSSFEPANVVDVINSVSNGAFAIARAITRKGIHSEGEQGTLTEAVRCVADAINNLADAVREHGKP